MIRHPSVTDPAKADPVEILPLPSGFLAFPDPSDFSELTQALFTFPSAKNQWELRSRWSVTMGGDKACYMSQLACHGFSLAIAN